jgi:uncharacterized protein YbdZ (MbtH family)
MTGNPDDGIEIRPMRLFVHTVAVDALETTQFGSSRKSWVGGYVMVHAYGEQGQDITWRTLAPPPLGTYVVGAVTRRQVTEQHVEVTWTTQDDA